MKDRPLVSIVTPSYNQGDFIEDTILSIKNQKYPSIEHIIVDANSTDQTHEIIRKYESDYRMVWIAEEDEGPADALNKGFRVASGSIYGYLNSDDLLLQSAVENIVDSFKSQPEKDVIYSNGFIIDKNNKIIKKVYSSPFYNPFLYLYGAILILQQSSFWRCTVFEQVGGFNLANKTCWDGELWLDISLAGGKFHKIPGFIGCLRHHKNSITSKEHGGEKHIKDHNRMFRRLMNRNPNILDKIGKYFGRLGSKIIQPYNIFPKSFIKQAKVEVNRDTLKCYKNNQYRRG